MRPLRPHARTLLSLLGMLLLLAPFASAKVQICDGNGNCYIFDDPPCKDWSLASTTTCVDIVAVIAPAPGGAGGTGQVFGTFSAENAGVGSVQGAFACEDAACRSDADVSPHDLPRVPYDVKPHVLGREIRILA